MPRKWFSTYVKDTNPPSAEDRIRLPDPVYTARLFGYVDQFLPSESSSRVAQAMAAAAATTCEEIYQDRADAGCKALGVGELRRASLWLAVAGLAESQGRLEAVDQFLSIDRTILERAVLLGESTTDDALRAYMFLLRRWMNKRPTHWEAWADIEELIGS